MASRGASLAPWTASAAANARPSQSDGAIGTPSLVAARAIAAAPSSTTAADARRARAAPIARTPSPASTATTSDAGSMAFEGKRSARSGGKIAESGS